MKIFAVFFGQYKKGSDIRESRCVATLSVTFTGDSSPRGGAFSNDSNDIEPGRIGIRLLNLVILIEAELLVLDADLRAGRDGLREEDVAADDGALANDGVAAENRGARIDRDVILDGRMAFLGPELAAARRRERTERDALIDLDVEYLPIVAPGLMSMPVLLCASSVMMRGMTGTCSS